MRARLAELEAALAASFDRDHLAVYGDTLQSIGDPRGELIAIDLAGDSAERAARKRELVEAWLGEQLAALVHVAGEIDHGFLTVHATGRYAEAATRLLASPAGAFVRVLTLHEIDRATLTVLDTALRASPRPWLAELDLAACEPGAELLAMLAELPWLAGLERVRLPSLRRDDDVVAVERALAVLRDDAEVVVARAYLSQRPSREPPARVVVPAPWPWPPPDTLRHARLHVAVIRDPFGETIELAELVRVVERHYDELDELARAAWIELCALAVEPDCYSEFSASAFERVLAPLDATDHPFVADLRTLLHGRRYERVGLRRDD